MCVFQGAGNMLGRSFLEQDLSNKKANIVVHKIVIHIAFSFYSFFMNHTHSSVYSNGMLCYLDCWYTQLFMMYCVCLYCLLFFAWIQLVECGMLLLVSAATSSKKISRTVQYLWCPKNESFSCLCIRVKWSLISWCSEVCIQYWYFSAVHQRHLLI